MVFSLNAVVVTVQFEETQKSIWLLLANYSLWGNLRLGSFCLHDLKFEKMLSYSLMMQACSPGCLRCPANLRTFRKIHKLIGTRFQP